jgi:hypothetical protein
VSLSVWLRVGWLVLLADVAYWLWLMGHTGKPGPEGSWGYLNIITFYGGWLLFGVLLVVSYGVWRVNQRELWIEHRRQGAIRNWPSRLWRHPQSLV